MRFGLPRDPLDAVVRFNIPQVADFWTLQVSDLSNDGLDDLFIAYPASTPP